MCFLSGELIGCVGGLGKNRDAVRIKLSPEDTFGMPIGFIGRGVEAILWLFTTKAHRLVPGLRTRTLVDASNLPRLVLYDKVGWDFVGHARLGRRQLVRWVSPTAKSQWKNQRNPQFPKP